MDIQTATEKLTEFERKMYAYAAAQSALYWDASTFAPEKSAEGRGIAMGILSGESHKLMTGPEIKEVLDTIEQAGDAVDRLTALRAAEAARQYRRLTCIPQQEVIEFAELKARSMTAWETAKANNDYKTFAPYLQKLVEFSGRFARYIDPEKKPYDTLIDGFERGATAAELQGFFDAIKPPLVELIQMVAKSPKAGAYKQLQDRINARSFDTQKQRAACREIAEGIGLDFSRFNMAESEHPFTTGPNTNDVRFTVHYHQRNPASAVFAALHEGGHAAYMLGIGDELMYTFLNDGASSAMHEGQALLYENHLGRSRQYSRHLLGILKRHFPGELSDVTEQDFYQYINISGPSLIRTEADELTYCLHIIIRFEIEQMLFEGDADIDGLPRIWNDKYTKYLGITPPDDAQGILQDMHWADGLFGYFPSYALGNAFAAQLYAAMEKQTGAGAHIAKGDLGPAADWLRDRVHRYGMTKTAREIIRDATGEEFSPDYYIAYLKHKYEELYG